MGQPEEWRIPLPVSHLYKDSSMLADMALFGGSASVGSQKPNYCGLQRISRSFEKQTSLHPDCGFACSGSQSVWALVRDHFGCWKNHSLILTFGCQSHHTCGLWMTLVCRMTVRKGMWFGAHSSLSTRSEGGRPCREVLTQPVLTALSSAFLRNALPAQHWPSLLITSSLTWSPAIWSTVRPPTLNNECLTSLLLKCSRANLARTMSASLHQKQPCW